ncbi:MAG: SDR family NAD(P)-dependent oxidoreductase [Actinomycetota bacterium]
MILAGRRVLVTGGAVRVGRALALACAEAGMDCAIHYRASAAQAEEAVAECRGHGVRAVAIPGDLSRAEECRAVVAAAQDALGGVDVLVNSAANFVAADLPAVTEEDVDRVLAVNLKAPLFCAQAAAPAMVAQGWGRIVNIADVAGLEPWPRFLVHGAAKAGLVHLTRGLAQELAPHVLVNAIALGTVLMPPGATPEATARSAAKAVLGRVGAPADAAGALRYLLEADYVTGHTLVVDGGRMVRA